MATLEEYSKAYSDFNKASSRLNDIRNMLLEAARGASNPDGFVVKITDAKIADSYTGSIDGLKWPNTDELAKAFTEYQNTKLKVNTLFKQLNSSDQAGAKEPPDIRRSY